MLFAKVDYFADISELIILEQSKNTIPQHMAVYVNEQKPSTRVGSSSVGC